MTQSCGRPHYLRNKETLVENKWTAKDGCLKSSADSLYESIPPSSRAVWQLLILFQTSFWPWVCFSPPPSSCFHNPIVKSQNQCSLSTWDMKRPRMQLSAWSDLEIPAFWYWGKKSRIFMYLMRRIIQDFAFNTQTSGSYFKIRKEVNTSQAEFFSFSGSSKEPT